jgi:cytochrome c5
MTGVWREFASMDRGVEIIVGELRNGVATVTREDSRPIAQKANVPGHFLRAHSKTPRHIWAAGDAKQQTFNPARKGPQRRKLMSAFCQSCHESGQAWHP